MRMWLDQRREPTYPTLAPHMCSPPCHTPFHQAAGSKAQAPSWKSPAQGKYSQSPKTCLPGRPECKDFQAPRETSKDKSHELNTLCVNDGVQRAFPSLSLIPASPGYSNQLFMFVVLVCCWLQRDGRKGRVGLTPRSRNTLRKAVSSTQGEGGRDMWAVGIDGQELVVPTDHPVKAVSRVWDRSGGPLFP